MLVKHIHFVDFYTITTHSDEQELLRFELSESLEPIIVTLLQDLKINQKCFACDQNNVSPRIVSDRVFRLNKVLSDNASESVADFEGFCASVFSLIDRRPSP